MEVSGYAQDTHNTTKAFCNSKQHTILFNVYIYMYVHLCGYISVLLLEDSLNLRSEIDQCFSTKENFSSQFNARTWPSVLRITGASLTMLRRLLIQHPEMFRRDHKVLEIEQKLTICALSPTLTPPNQECLCFTEKS